MFAQVGNEDFSVCWTKQLVGNVISLSSETECSNVQHVSVQVGSLLKLTWALTRSFYV